MLPKPSSTGRRHFLLNSEMLVLGALVVLAAVLRTAYLTSKSLWMDEGFSIYLGQTSTASFLAFIRTGELNMVVYYALLRGWMHFGQSEFFIRLFSVIPSVATIPVVYFLGRRLVERRLGLVAALLVALHPAHIAYAQEVRGYALAVLLVSLSSLFFLRLIEQPRWTNCAAYVLFTTLAIYTHMFAGLIVLAQWTSYFAFSRRTLSWQTITKIAGALAIALAPMMIFVLTKHSAVANWIQRPTWHDLLDLFHFLTLPKYWMVLYLFLWGAALWAMARSRAARSETWCYEFLLAWLFLPMLLVVAVSLYKPVLVSRFLLICVPAAVLVAAAGLWFLRRWLQIVVLAAAVLASFNSVLSYYRHPQVKEDWRGASRYVSSQSQSGDTIIVLPVYGRFTFDYYQQQIAPGNAQVAGKRIWLVAYASSKAEAQQTIQKLRATPENSYCESQAKQLNLIQVWLLEKCGREGPSQQEHQP